MARDTNGRYAKGSNNATEGHPACSSAPKAPRSLFRHVLEDSRTREDLVKNLRKLAKTPRGAIYLLEKAADYLEGKPKQAIEVTAKRSTTFKPAASPALPSPEESLG